ncbi:MAG: PAS domain S-box protein [Myxococcales bacterium]|nr:MAG: PAS domain S-box protein [Myxococcales bacterium]
MIRFSGMKIRGKLAATFVAVLLPLIAAEILAIYSFSTSLHESAELELTNIVHHLYRLCVAQARIHHSENEAPMADDVTFVREIIKSLKVGKTGYPYVMTGDGTLVIHPEMEGKNIIDSRDSKGFAFIKSICDAARQLGPFEVGTMRYPWLLAEKGEKTPRMKILKYVYFQKWDWVIAAGSYEEEVYAALSEGRWRTYPLVVMSVVFLFTLTIALQRMIARPLADISSAALRMADGDLHQRVPVPDSKDEFAELAIAFNTMAEQIHDYTENLEAAVRDRTRQLSESREKYRNLVRSTANGVVTADRKGIITFVNPGMESLLGYSREEAVGRSVWDLYVGGREQARKIRHALSEQGHIANFEMELIGKERVVPIRITVSILRDSKGEEIGTLGIFNDITQERQLREELRRAQVHIVQTMKLRALGDLVAGVAHEINNPLMAAATMVYILDSELTPECSAAQQHLKVIRRCHDRIGKIVNHLREFSRQAEMEFREIDVHAPLENALLITGQQLLNHGMLIERDLASDLPRIEADPNYLEQVFLDLIANARDAMENIERAKILRVSSRTSELDGRPAVTVTIADTGIGIPEELRDKIFEPFFTTKETGKGTGLGLPISFGIVSDHGGKIDIRSKVGEGAAFDVILPVRRPGGKANEGGETT